MLCSIKGRRNHCSFLEWQSRQSAPRWGPVSVPGHLEEGCGEAAQVFHQGAPQAPSLVPCCSLLGPITGHITNKLPPGTPFLCPLCHPHACCQLLCQGCLCGCPPCGTTWWPLTRTSEVTARELPELEPPAQLLPLEGPKEEKVATHAPLAVSSSSSSCEQDDVENDLEMGPPQRLMVNSAVNTDPILLETPLRQSGLCQPEWRYWRRNGPEPRPGKPGMPGEWACLLRQGLGPRLPSLPHVP